MAVTESYRALGSWTLRLRPDTPQDVIDRIAYLGHVAISQTPVDARTAGDSLLSSARYVGVLRGIETSDDGHQLKGAGMALWLGDEEKKGSVIEDLVSLDNSTFTAAITALLPESGSIVAGTLHSVSGTYTGTHQYQSPREAIDYVCQTMGAAWRVNGDGTLDAGLQEDLFVSDPQVAIIRRGRGTDMALRALHGATKLDSDVEDFTTRVLLLASGTGGSTATGSADINPALNPYKDVHGNPVAMTRLVSESSTDATNAPARAQLQLNRFSGSRTAMELSTAQHDFAGANPYDPRQDLQVGDMVWVYDPESGLIDLNNEVIFHGQRLNAVLLQAVTITWPVTKGMGAGYRDRDGNWTDITSYIQWETGGTAVAVGGYDRSLTNGGGESVGSRPIEDTSIPDVPVFLEDDFVLSVYQSPNSGITKARVRLAWTQPANTDGSTVIDGDFYEIRYRTSDNPLFPVTWAEASGFTWGELHTWGEPIEFVQSDWHYLSVSWDSQVFDVQELTPGIAYDWQIRAVDNATPANYSQWSPITQIQTRGDTIAPATPAAPTVAASRIAIQITHELGLSSGGTYNLDPDLNHLQVHAQYEPTFTPDDTTLIGKVQANNGLMLGGIPVVATFPVESTEEIWVKVVAVDEAGNKSLASLAANVTALLVDDAHISDLTVSKVTAGTISADWLLAGSIKTATEGARLEADIDGLRLYGSSGDQTVAMDAEDGSVTVTGVVQTGFPDLAPQRVVVGESGDAKITFYPELTAGDTTSYLTMETFTGGFGALTQLHTRDFSGDLWGGGLLVSENAAILRFFQANTVNDWYHWIGPDGGQMFRGKISNANMDSSKALWTYVWDFGGAIAGLSYSYGPTMIGPVGTVATIDNGGAGYVTGPTGGTQVHNSSLSGVTVSWGYNIDGFLHVWHWRT